MVERVECGPDTSDRAVRRVTPWGFNSDVIRTTGYISRSVRAIRILQLLESLILAQDERWRRA